MKKWLTTRHVYARWEIILISILAAVIFALISWATS
jgi:hypothetical protein